MNLTEELRSLLGADVVATDGPTRREHAGDKWFASHPPDAVIFGYVPTRTGPIAPSAIHSLINRLPSKAIPWLPI